MEKEKKIQYWLKKTKIFDNKNGKRETGTNRKRG